MFDTHWVPSSLRNCLASLGTRKPRTQRIRIVIFLMRLLQIVIICADLYMSDWFVQIVRARQGAAVRSTRRQFSCIRVETGKVCGCRSCRWWQRHRCTAIAVCCVGGCLGKDVLRGGAFLEQCGLEIPRTFAPQRSSWKRRRLRIDCGWLCS